MGVAPPLGRIGTSLPARRRRVTRGSACGTWSYAYPMVIEIDVKADSGSTQVSITLSESLLERLRTNGSVVLEGVSANDVHVHVGEDQYTADAVRISTTAG